MTAYLKLTLVLAVLKQLENYPLTDPDTIKGMKLLVEEVMTELKGGEKI